MWVEKCDAEQLGTAVKKKKYKEVEGFLKELFQDNESSKAALSFCPSCKQELIRKTLPYLEIQTFVCPQDHGLWIHPKSKAELLAFIRSHIRKEKRVRNILLVLLSISILFSSISLLVHGRDPFTQYMKMLKQNALNERMGLDYWPVRTYGAIPIKESTINRPDELLYFKELAANLDHVMTNRINMDGVLRTYRSAHEFEQIYAYYKSEQMNALSKIESMAVPEKFKDLHLEIIASIQLQIDFFADFTFAKIQNPKTRLGDMLTHPALQESSRKLHLVWDSWKELYPNMDHPMKEALESRLCQSDII